VATLLVEIVTPEAPLWSGEALALIARSSDGDFTILPEHTATVGDLVPGVLRVQTTEGELSFCVHGVTSKWEPTTSPKRREPRFSRASPKRSLTSTWLAPKSPRKRPKRNWPLVAR